MRRRGALWGRGGEGGREGVVGSHSGFVTMRDEPFHTDVLFSLSVVTPHEEQRRRVTYCVGIEIRVVKRCFLLLHCGGATQLFTSANDQRIYI